MAPTWGYTAKTEYCKCAGDWHETKLLRAYYREVIQKDGKEKRKFTPFGWICPNCKKIKLDETK